ncbi:A24 family peptidase [Fangia hongkongensis]|uniref:A24 family peptidase n=1 Tax=Fangia hongkongensis TaxID=270495 RepID=UPI0003767302|nr:prepilin peptidase [Fangia hongkongensis]MBK2125879.1 prepilin peptidase [Fangia hongkongensis]
MNIVMMAGLLALSAIISVDDIKNRRIKNTLVVALFPIFIGISIYNQVLGAGIINLLIVLIVGSVLFFLGTMGAGDVKLMALYGILFENLMSLLLVISVVGGLLTASYILYYVSKKDYATLKTRGIPYGVAISVGGFISYLFVYVYHI